MGIAYTGIGLIHGEGDAQRYTAWPPEFDWQIQSVPHVPPSNCIPSANMFRRAMWERAGGFRQQYAPGEDTEFWTRGLSVGFTAKRVSDESLFEYRTHQGSASRTKTYTAIDLWLPWMHDRQFPMAAPADVPPIVRSYSEPIISIVIPCSPEHVRIIPSAIESVLGQDFREWEMIVVFDGIDDREFRDVERHYPFIRAFRTWGNAGAGFARNVGLEEAKAPLIMWLDADDYIFHQPIRMLDSVVRSARTMKTILTFVGGGSRDPVILQTALSAALPLSAHLDCLHCHVPATQAGQYARMEFASGAALRNAFERLEANTNIFSELTSKNVREFCSSAGIELGDRPAAARGVTASFPEDASNTLSSSAPKNWSNTAIVMTNDGKGFWTTVVTLKPGNHGYKFWVDGKLVLDPANPVAVADGFGWSNSVVKVRLLLSWRRRVPQRSQLKP